MTYIKAQFDSMGAAVSQMRGAYGSQENDEVHQMNQFMAANDYWDDDAYGSAGMTMAVWRKSSQGSAQELSARADATNVSTGLYQDCLSQVRSTFATST